VENDLRR